MTPATVALPGDGALRLRLPAATRSAVLRPRRRSGQALPLPQAVRDALRRPLAAAPLAALGRRSAGTGTGRVLILVDDVTRATPVADILPVVVDELETAGVRRDALRVAFALGTHRPMLPAEIAAKLGPMAEQLEVINTPAQHAGAFVATGADWHGVPIEVHRAVPAAALVIGIGSVVPHSDAGFSGGCKIVLPGMSSEQTVMENHLLTAYSEANQLGRSCPPARAQMEQVVRAVGLDFVVNLVLDAAAAPVAVYAGDFVAAQRAAARRSREVYGIPCDAPADVVVANAYPAELDLWQGSKAIWAAELLVRPGGTVILYAPCREGIGPHPEYLELLRLDPDLLLAKIRAGEVRDRNVGSAAVQIGRMLRRMQLVVVAPGLDAAAFAGTAVGHAADVQSALDRCLHAAPEAQVAVLTHGSESLPLVPRP